MDDKFSTQISTTAWTAVVDVFYSMIAGARTAVVDVFYSMIAGARTAVVDGYYPPAPPWNKGVPLEHVKGEYVGVIGAPGVCNDEADGGGLHRLE